MSFFLRVAGFSALVLLLPSQILAELTSTHLAVVESPALEGVRFGEVGQYERLRGVVVGSIDPEDQRHRHIVNIDRAPRNEAGRVEYRTTIEIYRPLDMSRWNQAIFHTVSNRGGAGAADVALLERGFVFVRVGWQGDLQPTGTNIVADLPFAHRADDSPIVAPTLEEFIFDDDAPRSRRKLTYPAAALDPANGMLSVRATQNERRDAPDDLKWTYVSDSEIEISRPTDFDGGAIYEFIYQAKNPIVLGLGFVAIRDTISFLRYHTEDAGGAPNPLANTGLPRTALSLGISQSGRVLRDFLYLGFNEDTAGRIVFDGMHPHIAGSRKSFTNFQFGQPGRWQKQHEDHVYPGDQFPFTYSTMTDPVSGRTDGLLARCEISNTCPKIIHSDSEAELWQARASLVVTDPIGEDIKLPDNVRAYLVAGTQHGGGPGVHAGALRRGICQQLHNPMALAPIRVALSVALHAWVTKGTEPPVSRFPTVANGGLLPPTDLAFPDIQNVHFSGSYNPLRLADHRSLPPMYGAPYMVLLPATDTDGNMIQGIRHPNLVASIGTYTGWNLRSAGFGKDEQCRATGSFIPFASSKEARRQQSDPRPSIEERYAGQDAYVRTVASAATTLVAERLLLPHHADAIIERARESAWPPVEVVGR